MSGSVVGVHQLQILRDKFDVDQPAGDIFEVPALAVALLLGDRRAHLHHVARDQRDIARALQDAADDRPPPAPGTQVTPTPPARA